LAMWPDEHRARPLALRQVPSPARHRWSYGPILPAARRRRAARRTGSVHRSSLKSLSWAYA
jgi:hypothetical protein